MLIPTVFQPLPRVSKFYPCFYVLIFVCVSLFQPAYTYAESSRQLPAQAQYDIASQALRDAVALYARTSGVSVVLDGQYSSLSSAAVHGVYSPSDALRQLILGTGLKVRMITPGSAVVYKPEPKPVGMKQLDELELAGVDRSNAAHMRYVGALQRGVLSLLCSLRVTQPGQYRLALQLKLDRHGKVLGHVLLGSTGDISRDRQIDHLLVGHAFRLGPPSELSATVVLLILPQPSDDSSYCDRHPEGA